MAIRNSHFSVQEYLNSYLRMSVQISEMQFVLGDELLSLL